MLLRGRLLVLVGLLLLQTNLSGAAPIYGTPGTVGTPGSDGPPAVDGGVGGDGQDLTWSIVGPSIFDFVGLFGGNGGDGGSSPSLPTGTVPLAGGDGGAGGDATMTATNPGDPTLEARAESHGGLGGNGGTPSAGSALRPPGAP